MLCCDALGLDRRDRSAQDASARHRARALVAARVTSDILTLLRFAGYHNDGCAWVQLVCEFSIDEIAAGREYVRGIELRQMGTRCECPACVRQGGAK